MRWRDLNLGPYAQVALQVNYPVHATTWDWEIVSAARDAEKLTTLGKVLDYLDKQGK